MQAGEEMVGVKLWMAVIPCALPGKLSQDSFAIIHKEYTPTGQFSLTMLKAMSRVLCLIHHISSLPSNLSC